MCGRLHNWGKNLSREVFSPGTDAGIGDAKKFVPSLDDHGFVGPDLKGSGQDRADRRKATRGIDPISPRPLTNSQIVLLPLLT